MKTTTKSYEVSHAPRMHSIWCTHDGVSREEFERAVRAMIARRGEDPDTVTFHDGFTVLDVDGTEHPHAVNVIWDARD